MDLRTFIDDYCDDLIDSFNSIISILESPIERILCANLLRTLLINCNKLKIANDKVDKILDGSMTKGFFLVHLQKTIKKYRVDIYIEYREEKDSPISKLIIECNGHDYHEKTKNQAKYDKEKDRILQTAGYAVFRFTGSEIWDNALKCADSVLEFFTKREDNGSLPKD